MIDRLSPCVAFVTAEKICRRAKNSIYDVRRQIFSKGDKLGANPEMSETTIGDDRFKVGVDPTAIAVMGNPRFHPAGNSGLNLSTVAQFKTALKEMKLLGKAQEQLDDAAKRHCNRIPLPKKYEVVTHSKVLCLETVAALNPLGND